MKSRIVVALCGALAVALAFVLVEPQGPIHDPCRVCFDSSPAWMCYLIGCLP